MSEQTSSIISMVWAMCNPLRDDGILDGDYLVSGTATEHFEAGV